MVLFFSRVSQLPNNIINTLANGYAGYIPTIEAFEQGGYEVKLAGSSKLVPEAGNKIVLSAIKIINNLFY